MSTCSTGRTRHGDPLSTHDPLDLVGTPVRALSLRNRLLAWYDRAKRDLPWRRDTDPYRVLVSELMLQQTRVETVIPYYERWLERWPDLASLAAAELDEVLAAWSGLGYYRRARALHAIACQVTEERDGELPRTAAELEQLPGIGPYTAAAVASIAHDEAVPVVDGNVVRVLCRLLMDDREPSAARRRTVREAARRLVTLDVGDEAAFAPPADELRPGDLNQALMELGATVCIPGEPRCLLCPWSRTCLGKRTGTAQELPKRKPRRPTREVVLHAAVVWREERFLLVRREEGALLSGLWELPTTREGEDPAQLWTRVADWAGTTVEPPEQEPRSVQHAITDRRITLHVHEVRLPPATSVREDGEGLVWIRRVDLRDFGVSSMTRKALTRS